MDSNDQVRTHASPSPSKQHRRKSWLHGSSLASLFSSRGDPNRTSAKRSQSLDASAGMTRSHSTRSLSKPSSIVSKLSKATRHGLRRLPTSIDLRRIPEDSPPPPPKTEPSEFIESGYLLTTGEEEADRQQLKNDLVKLAFEGEFALPIDFQHLKGGQVLDIGCGTGCWTIELAQACPDLHVIGIDSSENMFPDMSTIPPNCELLKLNALGGLRSTFADETFDYIHIRFMCFAFTFEQYSQVIKDCWRLLKPGGHLEVMEMDMLVYSPGPLTERLNQDVVETARSRKFKPRIARHLASLIPSDGILLAEKYRSLPIGLWGGRLGVMFRDDLFHILSLSRQAVNQHNISLGRPATQPEEFERLLKEASRELEQYHSYSNFHFIVAQKPYTTTTDEHHH